MKIAVMGTGGREHALVWKLSQECGAQNVWAIGGNAGTQNNVFLDTSDFAKLGSYLEEHGFELLVIGPEAPLANGLADALASSRVSVFGPTQQAARLESSKIWAKQFMQRHKVSTADFWTFDNAEDPKARKRIEELNGVCVVKYDGLAGGKGVFVCSEPAQGIEALEQIKAKHGSNAPLLIEQRLSGVELSVIAITDGQELQLLPCAQDYKQRSDGDSGPNTGGMGAICPFDFADRQRLEQITNAVIAPTVAGLKDEKISYCGFLYFGLIYTNEGPFLLEYNARLGDPETEVVLPALSSSLLDLMGACFSGNLGSQTVRVSNEVCADVVLVAQGYPGAYETGKVIHGLDAVRSDVLLFHAGTKQEGDRILTAGGRVLNVVGKAPTLDRALSKTYRALEQISFEGCDYRRDIGRRNNVI